MSLYHEYYDRLFSTKDYAKEARVTLSIYKKARRRLPKKILDVGCGTGSHDLLFAEKGADVVGCDIDPGLIKQAQKKMTDRSGLRFVAGSVDRVHERGFDLAVALFHVVNYVDDASKLEELFSGVAERLASNGLFVFDCWNGVAAIADPPKVKKTTLVLGDETIRVTTKPKTIDLMNQTVMMTNRVAVTKQRGRSESFDFAYKSTLWTPCQIAEALAAVGMEVLRITTWARPSVTAGEKDWKILFVCQKR